MQWYGFPFARMVPIYTVKSILNFKYIYYYMSRYVFEIIDRVIDHVDVGNRSCNNNMYISKIFYANEL